MKRSRGGGGGAGGPGPKISLGGGPFFCSYYCGGISWGGAPTLIRRPHYPQLSPPAPGENPRAISRSGSRPCGKTFAELEAECNTHLCRDSCSSAQLPGRLQQVANESFAAQP